MRARSKISSRPARQLCTCSARQWLKHSIRSQPRTFLGNRIAVCAGSWGPGNPHLISGLYDCQRSRVPVLAIAAQIPSYELGRGYFQETRPELLFRDCSHYCELISQPEQVPRVLGIAMRTALLKRGVPSSFCQATLRCGNAAQGSTICRSEWQ